MNQFNRFLLLAFSSLLFLISCQKDTLVESFLNIEDSDMLLLSQPFIEEAGHRQVTLNTNLDVVKVSSPVEWCQISVIENKGKFIRIDVFPNEGFEDRSTEILVYGKGVESIKIPVNQWSREPKLVVAESEGIDIIDGELDFNIHVTSNVDFSFELPNWISNVGDNSPFVGSRLYTFLATSIPPGERVGYVKVIAEGHPELNQIIEINQLQNVLMPVLKDFLPLIGEKESVVVLSGENFGTNKDLVQVYFNELKAEVLSVSNNEISVVVPRAPGNSCTIRVKILDSDLAYTVPFSYSKSWGLYTVTGDGNTNFRGGTLAEGRLRARYLSLDDNGNLFASHRDETATTRYVIRINESQNKVEGFSGSVLTPNGTTVGRNNVVYVANDQKNGTSFYELNPSNNWTPIERIITYPGGAPPTSSYMYRLIFVPGAIASEDRLYGLIGHNVGPVVEINPSTLVGKVIYNGMAANPTWYGLEYSANHPNKLFVMVNNQSIGYGLYTLNLTNPGEGITKLNSQTTTLANSGVAGLTNNLETSGFGLGWDFAFHPDGHLYVSDNNNHIIRKINLTNKTIETVIGLAGTAGMVDGAKDKGRLNQPRGMVWNKEGTTLYISDFGNSRIRKWTYD